MSNKIEIITPNDGWILHRMAQKLAERLDGVTVVQAPSNTADITYFLHYHMYRPVTTRTAALFTHLEPEDHPLHRRWFEVAEAVDLCISMSDFYTKDLPPEKTVVILPGVDERFKPRKLRVGVACQWAHGNSYRKGLDLLQRLHEECSDWIDLRLTNGEVADEDMVRWYQDLDVYLVASRWEGGPLPALEAAACGIPVVAPKVGVIGKLEQVGSVHTYRTGDYDGMVRMLRYAANWRSSYPHETIGLVFSWDRFAQQHREQFDKLLQAEAV